MATKQVNRPLVPVPSWANDLNLNDPGEPWDATPTKVEPGAGKRDDGFLPEENPAAQHLNQLISELGKWAQYFSDIQIQNWSPPIVPKNLIAQSAHALCYDRGLAKYVIVGENVASVASVSFTGDGYYFSEAGISLAGYSLTWAAAKIPTDTPSTTGSFFIVGGNNVITDVVAGTPTQRNLPVGADVALMGVWDGGNARFCAAGNDGGVNAQLWTSPAAAMTWALGAGIGVPPSATTAVCMAVRSGGGFVIVFGDTQTPDSWTSTDGGVNWTLRTPGITGQTGADTPRSIAYNAELAVYMLLMTTEVWISTDGLVWSLVADSLSVDFQFRCLATTGSLWVTADATDSVIYYSTDLGATWRKFFFDVDDLGAGLANDVVTDIVYSEYRREFATVAAHAGGDGQLRRSMSIGTTLLTSEGELVPTT